MAMKFGLLLGEEQRLRVTEEVLRRIFDSKREEVTGEWIKLHSKDLHNLYSLHKIISLLTSKRMRWVCGVER
jgi:hypothetical protein